MTDTATANPVHDFIAKAVADHPVVLFMKGVPEQPQCGFSAQVVQILDHLGADFVGVNVLQNDAAARRHQDLLRLADHPAALREGRVRRRLRHRARDVPGRRAEDLPGRAGRPEPSRERRDVILLEPPPGRQVFRLAFEPTPADIDENGHVNNVVYLRWAQDLGVAHWQRLAPAEEQATLGLGRAAPRDRLPPRPAARRDRPRPHLGRRDRRRPALRPLRPHRRRGRRHVRPGPHHLGA